MNKKRTTCFSLALLLVMLAVLGAAGTVSVSAEDAKQYTFLYTNQEITLDAQASDDEDWNRIDWTDIATVPYGTKQSGYSARFKGLWKEVDGKKRVYFLLEITDPTKITTSTAWKNDAFFVVVKDNGTRKNTATLRLDILGTELTEENKLVSAYAAKDTGGTDKRQFTAEGYFEVSTANFNVDFLVQDCYKSETYARIAWNNVNANSATPEGIGILAFPETAHYTFPHADAEITLDAEASADENWDLAEWADIATETYNTKQSGYSARFKGLWKEVDGKKRVYFLLEITDPTKVTYSDATNWRNDAFWIDLNDGSERYGGTFRLDSLGENLSMSSLTGSYSAQDTGGDSKRQYTAEGYFEVSSANFRFDFVVQDLYNTDTSKSHRCRLSWNNVMDAGTQSPLGAGTLAPADAGIPVGEDEFGRYHIYRAMGNITTDGIAADSEAWNAVPWSEPFRTTEDKGNGQSGFTAKMKILWQQDAGNAYLYFLIETNDQTTYSEPDTSKWPYDYFKIYVDEDCDGVNDQGSTDAMYIGNGSGSIGAVEFVAADRRGDGEGYTVEAKYTFRKAENCTGSVRIDVMTHDYTGSKWNRYAWKEQNGYHTAAAGIGLISDVPVFAIKTAYGASVRIDTETPNYSGIRFYTSVDADAIAELEAAGATVETGTLLLPTDTLENKGIGEFTKEALLSAGLTEGTDFYDIVNVDNGYIAGDEGTFIATLYNIRNYRRSFSAVGYARVMLTDGTAYTLYGGYDANGARSASQVARMALADPDGNYSEAQKEILNMYIEAETEPSYRIMEYNVLHQKWAGTTWANVGLETRSGYVADAIADVSPDVLVLTERFEEWAGVDTDGVNLSDLLTARGKNYLFAEDRIKGGTIVNRTPIAYNAATFRCVESGSRELGEWNTDGTSVVTFESSACKRVVSWAVLEDITDTTSKGTRIVVFATHWTYYTDTSVENVTTWQAQNMVNTIKDVLAKKEYACLPVVVAGDFNKYYNIAAYKDLLAGAGLSDVQATLAGDAGIPNDKLVVDHIAIAGCEATSFTLYDGEHVGEASDHKPVWCNIKIGG